MNGLSEARKEFDCFGSRCAVLVRGDGPSGSARAAAKLARELLEEWDARFSRFRADSELSRLNRDPRETVPVSPLMARFAEAVSLAGAGTGGLVDATLLDAIEHAGYRSGLSSSLSLRTALELAPPRRAAAGSSSGGWQLLNVDVRAGTLSRTPGLQLDSGGLAKGMFADVLAEMLAGHPGFAINCAGDLYVGGTRGAARPVEVESPFDGRVIHTFMARRTGVATSGIGRRSWLDSRGLPAHHLLDPSTGEPAYTGIVQVTALAPTALQAEIKAKAALLSGPSRARRWLSHGGLVVLDDGSLSVIDPPPLVSLSQLSGFAHPADTPALEHV